jgi:hypothetical protein
LLFAAASLVGSPIVAGVGEQASAASSPLAVVVVGPAGSATSSNRLEGRRIVDQLRALGARVRFVYSPYATWGRVSEATQGANLLVYLGRGRGNPGPYGAFDARTMNGLGLNAAGNRGNTNVRYYGEAYLKRGLGLAKGAVVILERVPYAAGSSEPGRAAPTRRTATLRADNYALPFLSAGATAVFASDRSVSTIVHDLFRSRLTMRSIFWNSPWTSTRSDSAFSSLRSPGAAGILAPYVGGRYEQSVIGRLSGTAASWRLTWGAPAPIADGSSVRVSSVTALLSALANDGVTEIVVADGTYRVSPAGRQAADSLWIGSRFAGRNNPVTVRAETRGGVVLDGGGASGFGAISFEEGAHHQTWDGFVLANGTPGQTGVVLFGGYAGKAESHHITLRNMTFRASILSPQTSETDAAIYFSTGAGHDHLVDGLTVDGGGGLASAIQFYHSEAGSPNASNVTIRNVKVTGTSQAIILWDGTLHDIRVDNATVVGAIRYAVRYEAPGATNMVLANITSTGSGSGKGFHSSLGSSPSGVTFLNNSFH